ncbi:MAG: hypothetical protein LUD72_07920 [Bacteroidales bacterium]|nr:hypothetical protein [Bacteroidales bacterium]
MKKSINLKESQLASLVAESAQNILSVIPEGKKRGNITDAEKAFRRANRDLEHERNGGRWIAVDRPHKNKKVYDRKRDKMVGETQEEAQMESAIKESIATDVTKRVLATLNEGATCGGNGRKTANFTKDELKGIVESALQELDWRTIASAANKRRDQALAVYNEHPNIGFKAMRDSGAQELLDKAGELADYAGKTFDKTHNTHGMTVSPQFAGNTIYQYPTTQTISSNHPKWEPFERFVNLDKINQKEIGEFAKGNSKYYHDSHQWENVVRNLADNLTKGLNESLQKIK